MWIYMLLRVVCVCICVCSACETCAHAQGREDWEERRKSVGCRKEKREREEGKKGRRNEAGREAVEEK